MTVRAQQGLSQAEFRQQIREQAQAAREQAQAAREQAQAVRAEADAIRAAAQTGARTRVEVITDPRGRQETILVPRGEMNHMPPEIVDLSLAFMVLVAVIVVGLPIARAVARWFDRRQVEPSGELPAQMRQLQESVDAVALEVERIAEAQRYTARLLTERQGAALQSHQPAS